MDFIAEVKKRKSYIENINLALGAELKNKRVESKQTLDYVSDNICSTSYLSKIENSKIAPSRYYVKELCAKLDLKEDKVEVLFDLKNIIINTIMNYQNNNYYEIEKAVKSGEGLNNYRYSLIKFIYYIALKDLYNANKLHSQLEKLFSSMSDFDLSVFGVFAGILEYYNKDFIESLSYLEVLRSIVIDERLHILRDLYIYKCYYALNRMEILFEYETVKELVFNSGRYDLLEEIHYILCLYLVKNRCFKKLDEKKKHLKNIKNINTIDFIKKYINKDVITYSEYNENNLNDFCYILKLLNSNKELAITKLRDLNVNSYRYDCSYLYLQYKLLEDDMQRFRYISELAMPELFKTNESYWINYFLNEMCFLCGDFSKYKTFNLLYVKAMDLR